MGGLTSKSFKLGKKSETETEEEKRTSVAGVQYRDTEFQLSRETKSAYYYGQKNGQTGAVDKSDEAAVSKRVVLQKAGNSSDHTLFKRVRETPTAIYYEPNDDVDGTEDIDEKKNIVIENVAGVQYRDTEFQLSRETKSAYYYGQKNGQTGAVDKSDEAAVSKRVVLQKAGNSSDHTLFKRVRETPTAIYYEPNDDVDGTEDIDEKKNIVIENAPPVEKRIKVIRDDGSSDIKIRPESITWQKHDMIIEPVAPKKQREDLLNTYSVMVKNKETNAVPNATVTLDEDKGLKTIEEGKERESQLLEDEKKDETVVIEDNSLKTDTNVQGDIQNEKEADASPGKKELDASKKTVMKSDESETQTQTDTKVVKDEGNMKDESTIESTLASKSDTNEESVKLHEEKTESNQSIVSTDNIDEVREQSSADEAGKATCKSEAEKGDKDNEDNIRSDEKNNTSNIESESLVVQENVAFSDNKAENDTGIDSQINSGITGMNNMNDDVVDNSGDAENEAVQPTPEGTETEKEDKQTNKEVLIDQDSIHKSTTELVATNDISDTSTPAKNNTELGS